MKVIEGIVQGTQAWLDLRAKHNTASEAPAVMGASKYMSRSDLMKQKTTGITPDVGSAKQALFNRGHAAEAGARTILERIINEDLYPVTAVCEKTNLLASLDGLTMDEKTLFECKLWNEQLAEQVRAGDLEPHYYWQLEQELLVTGGEKVIFVTSDGTEDKFVSMEYRPVSGRAEQLIAAWKQFDADLANFKPEPVAVEAIGRTPETLPALHIEVTGMVTASNLEKYKEHALAVFAGINRELTTDQDFATAESVVKWCGEVESRLAAAKQHALSQTASIDALFRAIDDISAEAKRTRLELDKLVTKRKADVRLEIQQEATAAFIAHYNSLNVRLGKPYMPTVVTDFAGAMKGRRTVTSLKDAVATELARVKIEANAIADKIQTNLNTLRDMASAHAFLFADVAIIVQKAPDDLTMLVRSRIAEHEAAETRRIEAERARIRQEEIDRLAREQAEAAAQTALLAARTVPVTEAKQTLVQPAPIEAAAVRKVVALPRETEKPTLKVGTISDRLGFNLTAAFISMLGFEPGAKMNNATLYFESDFPLICNALIAHINEVQDKYEPATA